MSIINGANAVVGAGGAAAYEIERSLRFNSADSAYLSRTPASAGNRQIFTISLWIKRTAFLSTLFDFGFLTAGNDPSNTYIGISGTGAFGATYNGKIIIGNNASAVGGWTSIELRDPSAWYHFVIAIDTTQATANNRQKLYINGVDFGAPNSTFALNTTTQVNNNVGHTIGGYNTPAAGGYYANGYLAEYYLIDGQQLTASDFGEFNTDTGVWQPIAYTGTYGTNGFYLNFSDNSGTTSTTLGKDYSGNSNNWTPNNFSVTAGAGNDSLVDTPTPYGTDTGVGGEVRGNYATWNPLDRTAATYTNGNLEVSSTSSAAPYNMTTTIQLPTSGKWYCEVTALKGASNPGIGIGNNRPLDQFAVYRNTGAYITANISGIASSGTPATWTTGDVIGIAYDADAGTLSFYKNGSAQSGGFTSVPATGYCVAVRADSASGDGGTLNAGQRPFAYTAPSGFKALCTQNLPEPTVVDGGDYFNAVLYSGNSSTQNITGVGFAPDFTWLKVRNDAQNHRLFDTVRGANKRLMSSSTAAEATTTDELTAFGSDGFTLGANTDVNGTGFTYVAWNWKAGGTGVTNTAGTITSTVSANTTAGFSVVTYTGNNTANQTVGHGIGVAPSMIIVKNRTSGATSWAVYHASVGIGKYFELNKTDTPTTNSAFFDQVTSTVFGFDAGGSFINASGDNYVAYCFAPVAGYSAFGSYTGNGSADGPFVYTGHRPRWIMVKASSAAVSGWVIYDTVRSTYNVVTQRLFANSSAAEDTGLQFDILSNGFKVREAGGQGNDSGVTYIYAAFAENPFKYSLAR